MATLSVFCKHLLLWIVDNNITELLYKTDMWPTTHVSTFHKIQFLNDLLEEDYCIPHNFVSKHCSKIANILCEVFKSNIIIYYTSSNTPIGACENLPKRGTLEIRIPNSATQTDNFKFRFVKKQDIHPTATDTEEASHPQQITPPSDNNDHSTTSSPIRSTTSTPTIATQTCSSTTAYSSYSNTTASIPQNTTTPLPYPTYSEPFEPMYGAFSLNEEVDFGLFCENNTYLPSLVSVTSTPSTITTATSTLTTTATISSTDTPISSPIITKCTINKGAVDGEVLSIHQIPGISLGSTGVTNTFRPASTSSIPSSKNTSLSATVTTCAPQKTSTNASSTSSSKSSASSAPKKSSSSSSSSSNNKSMTTPLKSHPHNDKVHSSASSAKPSANTMTSTDFKFRSNRKRKSLPDVTKTHIDIINDKIYDSQIRTEQIIGTVSDDTEKNTVISIGSSSPPSSSSSEEEEGEVTNTKRKPTNNIQNEETVKKRKLEANAQVIQNDVNEFEDQVHLQIIPMSGFPEATKQAAIDCQNVYENFTGYMSGLITAVRERDTKVDLYKRLHDLYDKILKRHHVLIGELIDFSPVLEDDVHNVKKVHSKIATITKDYGKSVGCTGQCNSCCTKTLVNKMKVVHKADDFQKNLQLNQAELRL